MWRVPAKCLLAIRSSEPRSSHLITPIQVLSWQAHPDVGLLIETPGILATIMYSTPIHGKLT